MTRRRWIGALALAATLVLAVAWLVRSGEDLDRWRTLNSLRKLDEHPLYVMTYFGDYGFGESLRAQRPASGGLPQTDDVTGNAWACTCFAALGRDHAVFGRNFDWYDHPALLLFTDPPDGYASVSMVDISYLGFGTVEPLPATRDSLLYAPLTPFDGMNECGLAVGMMAVPKAKPAHDPEEATLSGLEAIRLLLDHARDVDEALRLMREFNIVFSGPPLHYLIADAAGGSAVVEYVNGEMKVLPNELPWQVATNFVISEAQLDGPDSACWRYNRASSTLRAAGGSLAAEGAMVLLEEVSQQNTIWSIVYGMSSGKITVSMSRNYETVHRFTLGRAQGGCPETTIRWNEG